MGDLQISKALAQWQPLLPVAVAYSGGADSTALLWACAQRWPGQVAAIHVNHGLQHAAMAFEQHCRQQCAGWNIPLAVTAVQAHAAQGQSPEDAARIARYAALAQVASTGVAGMQVQSVALAQHADDQLETVLLAMSRGAGVAGLAGMRPRWQSKGIAWHRPYLDVASDVIRQELTGLGVAWVEDPTNTDERYTRNRIRSLVTPGLRQAFPMIATTAARSAKHAAEASQLLDELAAMDLAQVGGPPVIKALQVLSAPRLANVLRYWLRTVHGAVPTAVQLAELCKQLVCCTTRGHQIHLKIGNGIVERQLGVIDWYNPTVLV